VQTQLRETVALLRELGLALGGGGGGKPARSSKREVNPLDKGRGKVVVVGEEKEAILKAAKAGAGLAASMHSPDLAAGVASGSGGQAQNGVVVAARENVAGDVKRDGGQTAVLTAQTAVAAKVGKLVDV
jgi:hypothetical protein